MKKVIVVGAGLSGLSCAWILNQEGFNVTVLEKEDYLGGMASTYHIQDEAIPKTYHHVISNDIVFLDLLKRLRIAVDWRKVKTGLFKDGKTYPFQRPLDLLKFKPLSFVSRIQLGLLILRNMRGNAPPGNISVKEWVLKECGEEVYNEFISPFVNSYFGVSTEITALYLFNRFSSESSSISHSELGYVNYQFLLNRLSKGIEIRTNMTAEIRDRIVKTETDTLQADYVISTLPIIHPEIKYRACICLLLLLDERLTNYYWTTIMDQVYPFVAVFEAKNLHDYRFSKGAVYLVAYVDPDGSLFNMNDRSIFLYFLDGLRKIYPNIGVKEYYVYRNLYATPVYSTSYPKLPLRVGNVFYAGVSMIYPRLRMSGTAIASGLECAQQIVDDHE